MMTLSIDAMRSGIYWAGTHAALPAKHQQAVTDASSGAYTRLQAPAKHVDMVFYVMKHYPGNTNNSWTRQFFGDLSHGITRFDMFDFEPSTSGYTCERFAIPTPRKLFLGAKQCLPLHTSMKNMYCRCDYVDADGGAYPTVRAALNQLGSFEDIITAGTVQPGGGAVAVLYSETADIFYDGTGTYGAELRALYIALKHLQMPVEVGHDL
jgi:hypothetical protein